MSIPGKEDMQRALEERIGAELAAKFRSASVSICGLGGLGSNIAIALARAGVGRLHLIDFDRVDLSNMNRQQYSVSQLGMYKTEALPQTLHSIAPYCTITTDCVRITEDNLFTLLQNDSIICEAFDDPACKAMLVNGVMEQLPHAFLVAASGMAGIESANTVITRRITPHFYLCGDGISDAGDNIGLVASRVMVCAAHQAHMVLRIIAGELEN